MATLSQICVRLSADVECMERPYGLRLVKDTATSNDRMSPPQTGIGCMRRASTFQLQSAAYSMSLSPLIDGA